MKLDDFLITKDAFMFREKFGGVGHDYCSSTKLSYYREKDKESYEIPDDMPEEQIVELMQKCLAEGNDKPLFNLIKNNKVKIIPGASY